MKINLKRNKKTYENLGSMTPEQFKALIKAQKGEADAAFMYKRLAKKVKDEDDRKAFLRLSDDEARHESVCHDYTGKKVMTNPTKAIMIPLLYKLIGREKLYPIIAKAEYKAADKYKPIVADFPNIEAVMNDEVHHGDAVMGLLKK